MYLPIPRDPCRPSPCGLYSTCRVTSNRAVCSCLPNYLGQPPNCKPECMLSSECASNRACINMRCQDPCPGTCGQNARCRVTNHSPICSCIDGYTGDPFQQCLPERSMLFTCRSPYRPEITNEILLVFRTIRYATYTTTKPLYPQSLWPEFTMSCL